MQNNRKLYLFLIILGAMISSATVYFTYRSQHITTTTHTSPNPVKQHYQEWITKSTDDVWQLLAQHHFSYDQFLAMEKQLEDSCKQWIAIQKENVAKGPALSTDMKQTVTKVLQDFEIQPDTIEVISYINPNGSSPAFANDQAIFIDQELLSTYPHKAQLFTIAHELQHFIHKDYTLGYAAFTLLGTSKDQADHPHNILHRFQELRADLAAISKGKEYAEGQQQFLERFLQQFGDGRGISHPKITTRLAHGKRFLELYKA